MISDLNRDILECKCGKWRLVETTERNLNRDILECKYDLSVMSRVLLPYLNRDILECKSLSRLAIASSDASFK